MKRIFVYSSIVLGLLVATSLIASMYLATNTGPLAHFTVYGAGIPDAYDNGIHTVAFKQNNTGSWAIVSSVGYTTFVNGTTLSIPANIPTLIFVTVYLNYSLAPDASTALARTRVYLTIGGVYTTQLMTAVSSISYGGYWLCYHEYPGVEPTPATFWTPATDTTYSVIVQYQAYY